MVKIDKEVTLMEDHILEMAQYVINMHEKVLCVLERCNRKMALAIVQEDTLVNHLENEINDQAVCSLALLSPVAGDLRKVIANIKIACDLERIADYAKNISAFLIEQEELDDKVIAYATAMEKHFIDMLKDTTQAYKNKDAVAAFALPNKDEAINQLYQELKMNVLQHPDKTQVKQLCDVIAMLRNIERAGDHTKNICEHILYMVKGQHYDFG